MTGPLYRIGGFCARHHYPVIAAWLLLVAVLVIVARVAGRPTSDNLSLPGTGSTRALDLLQERLPQQANGSNPIVLQAREGTLTSSRNEQAVEATVESLEQAPHVIRVVNPLGAQGSSALSKDKTIGFIAVTLDLAPADLDKDEAEAVIDAADPARAAGLKVATGGYLGQEVSKPSTEISEVIGLAAAMVILLFAFGTVTAMGLPIVTAVLGLLSTLAVIGLLGHTIEVPTVAPTLATMIGLGVGIDYALFIVTRHKLQLQEGLEMEESVARATATAGGAVLFAGGTVVIALCSLSIAGIPLVSTLGFMAAIAVLVGVLGATTLLPALLAALGPRINSLRVPLGRTRPDDQEPHGYARWARWVARRPWRSIVASVVVLVVLALPVLDLHLGQSDVSALPTSTTARQAYDLLSEGFGPGQNGPLLVAVSLGTPAAPGSSGSDPRLQKLQQDLARTPGVESVSPPQLDEGGTAAVFSVIATTSPSSRQTEALVRDLRSSVLPDATAGTDLTAFVGGTTAGYIDLADRISDKLPSMIAIVVGLSMLVLLLAFRSVVIPIKAAVANLLSVAAAYGVVTAIFQKGWGAGLIGLEHDVPIVSFVPLLMFAILFGLSMDYEVFLLTQMQEHYKESKDPTKAAIDGLASTGRVITSAALIMVCVFTSFVLNGDPLVKQFGIGLAVAIALDATLVRCLFVPATMVKLGKAAWWLPSWLGRALPRISIEGEEYFARRRVA